MKRTGNIFFHILTGLLPLLTFGQASSPADSLLLLYNSQPDDTLKVHTLHDLFNAYLYNDLQQARYYAEAELDLSEKLYHPKGIAMAYYDLGVLHNNMDAADSARIYYLQALDIYQDLELLPAEAMVRHGLAILDYDRGDYDQALERLHINIDYYSTVGDSLSLAGAYQLKGFIHANQGNYRIALTEVLKAIALLEQLPDQIRLADAYNTLGGIEAHLENFEKCIEYNLLALPIYEEYNDKVYAAQTLNDIGNGYFYMGKYDLAIEYLNRSIALSQEMKSTDLEASSLENLGKTYAARGQYELALRHLQLSLELAEKSGNRHKAMEALNELGRVYQQLQQPDRAILQFNRAIALADSMHSMEGLQYAYQNRSLVYEKQGNYRQALIDHQAFAALTDSLYDKTKSQQIEELRTIFDTEKKEQEIDLQRKEIALLESEAEVKSLQNTLLGVGLGFSVLLLGIGIYGWQQRMKRHALEKEKLSAELAYKKKELTTHALHLARKNETLENLKEKAKALRAQEQGAQGYQQLIRTINADLRDDSAWENFSRRFEAVHKDFNVRVAALYPDITPNEYRLMAFIRMNLSSKEIASILNISIPGIKKARQRLRKKMNLSTQDSLEAAVLAI
jgi:tetratricopeptide (TPR) repeat protein